MMINGTPAALEPIAREVLAWVAYQRRKMEGVGAATTDDIRRIELCALATLDVSKLHDLYCIGPTSGHICHGDAEGACPHG